MTIKPIRWDGEPISKPGVYSGIPIEDYHRGDLCVGPSISSSGLRTIFSDSPMEYWVESPLNEKRLEPKESDAFILGRGAHHLLLGEADFGKYFVARPAKLNDKDWNGNRTECKEWLEGRRKDRLTVLTQGQVEAIRGMAGVLPWQEGLEDSGLRNSPVVRAGALKGLIEHSIIAQDPETGIWLKSRPDAIPTDSTEFNDLKTTADVTPRGIERTLDDYRYDMQAVLASMCLELAAGMAFTSFGFVMVQKAPPHCVEIVELTQDDLEDARLDLQTAIRTFAHCFETSRWPGPGGLRGDARYVQRSKWSRDRAMGRRSLLEMEISR